MNLNFSRVRSANDIIVSLSLIIAGAVLMFLPYGTGLNIAGFFFLLTGVLFLALFKSVYKLDGTEVTYYRKELYFKHEELEAIKKAVESDKPQIDVSKEGEGKTVKLDIYFSPKWGKSYIQLFEYIPYTYEPVTEIKGFNIDKIEKIIK